ncbi:MAG: valine--tRNA ligase [Parcubacteria group bacterium]
MNSKFLKPYDPTSSESRIYKLWEESGLFNPDNLVKEGFIEAQAVPYTIIMPPPNVTGILHMGHGLMLTIEDVLIRFARMQGKRTLWIPGTDHAAIATQSRVEKDILKTEKQSRHDLGREEFIKRVESFAKESHDTIASQIRVMGASCDWSREAFTLDDKREIAVRTAFKRMYDQGLIYRGERLVNWDPKGQTTIADDEIVYEEEKTKFYYLKYGPFIIGTTRPETKFGDKYVVMHPLDERYADYKHGDKINLEWINGPIEATVIKDERIDRELGTGVMTITPSHSQVDFDLATTHGLDKEQIIDTKGKLLPIAGEFAGMKIKDAREKIIEKLALKGLVEKIDENYIHNIATAERTGGIVEPQIMTQWFVAVNKPFKIPHSEINGIKGGEETTLKEIMRKPVESGQIKIEPGYFDKTYFHWINNLRDWCISRQIWYGHQIPVWYKGEEVYCGIEGPNDGGWTQDPDTLDTWFSSALWTFSTLGWPEMTEDLEIYHPTDVLETGYEILFFWVARMVLMTGFCLGTIPFKTVYLHGTVRDAKGRKMSKSLGNGIDPIDVAKEFGADAGRMALVVGTSAGTDTNISKDKIKGYKNFSNKLWNMARFVLTYNESFEYSDNKVLGPKWNERIEEWKKEKEALTKELESMRIHNAAERLYHYAWHTFADVIIEDAKKVLLSETTSEEEQGEAKYILYYLFVEILKALHPFMPFVTEEIWQELPHKKDRPFIMVEKW